VTKKTDPASDSTAPLNFDMKIDPETLDAFSEWLSLKNREADAEAERGTLQRPVILDQRSGRAACTLVVRLEQREDVWHARYACTRLNGAGGSERGEEPLRSEFAGLLREVVQCTCAAGERPG